MGTWTSSSLTGRDDALREDVAAQDAAEDVDQHGADVLVGQQDLERVPNLLGIGAAAHVEEVGRLAARQLDDVHRRHGQAGAVHHAADGAVEADVVERELRRLDLERILLAEVPQLAEVGVAVERVVVEVHLRVERQQVAGGGDDERVDLEHRRVGAPEGVVEGVQQLRDLPAPAGPRDRGRSRSSASGTPAARRPGCTCSRMMRSGVVAATSSMSMPPAALAMMMGRPAARSSRRLT